MVTSCQMRQAVIRFAWILAIVSPVTAGLDAGLKRKPGLAGLRDALRADWPRDAFHEEMPTTQDDAAYGTAKRNPLRCFEVHHPVLTPDGPAVDDRPRELRGESDHDTSSCDIVLMEHSFANSYGRPFVAQYWPPECAFDRVALRLDVVSEGRQFDRLALMYLGDIEVWRTSTAEPKPSPGIAWTIRKDFTPYLALWKQPQTLIFDLGNLVNEKYTGSFNATLRATFFKSDILGPNGVSADTILPISARRGAEGKGSAFAYPETPAETVLTLPRNINRGILTISATGQASEEFWWSNVPEKDKSIFDLEAGPLPGLSSYREVQVRIDNKLVGLALPFPVVFTGGLAPPLHRPVVGLQAFDLREHEIDISPFLGLLCDGMEHKFSIDVYGVNDTNGTIELQQVPMHWVVTGKVFLWLDKTGAQTMGSLPNISFPELDYAASSTVIGETVLLQQLVKRSLHVVGLVTTQQGTQERAWHQTISMGSDGSLSDKGDTQYVNGLYEHSDLSATNARTLFSTKASYPIKSDTRYRKPDAEYDFSIRTALLSKMSLYSEGKHIFPTGVEGYQHGAEASWNASTINTSRVGAAFFYSMHGGNSSGGSGNTDQTYGLAGMKPLYMRFVSVVNETTLRDREYGLGKRYGPGASNKIHDSEPARQQEFDASLSSPNLVQEEFHVSPAGWNSRRLYQEQQNE